MDGVKEAVSEGTVSLIEVVVRVEGIEAIPAELVLALGALHEFATTSPHNAYFASRTCLREEDLVGIAVKRQLRQIETPHPLKE